MLVVWENNEYNFMIFKRYKPFLYLHIKKNIYTSKNKEVLIISIISAFESYNISKNNDLLSY